MRHVPALPRRAAPAHIHQRLRLLIAEQSDIICRRRKTPRSVERLLGGIRGRKCEGGDDSLQPIIFVKSIIEMRVPSPSWRLDRRAMQLGTTRNRAQESPGGINWRVMDPELLRKLKRHQVSKISEMRRETDPRAPLLPEKTAYE